MKRFYHISSKALSRNVIFQTKEDFVVAMNDVALCVLRFDVCILCFCLMNNHFHFILKGTYESCYAFMSEFKRFCAMRMRENNGEVNGLKDVDLQFDELDSSEYLENAIAYVLRNPLAAHIICMPHFYEWSSVLAYFRGGRRVDGIPLNGLSLRKRREILRTRHAEVPDTYILNGLGYVDPCCYIAADEVEKVFYHPSRLMMALAKRVENDFEVKTGAASRITMNDVDLRTQLYDLIRCEFKVNSLTQLSADQRLKLCSLLHRNFNASVKQIARVLRLSQEVVASVL